MHTRTPKASRPHPNAMPARPSVRPAGRTGTGGRRLVPAILLTLLAGGVTAGTNGLQDIEVNGRILRLPGNTPVLIDDQPGQLSDLLGKPAGMQLRQGAAPARGVVPPLVFSYTLIGPVTQVEPLAVLGQVVTITADTVREGFADPGQLLPGTPMIIAGLVDANGSLYGTLAVRREGAGNKFLLNGHVQEVVASEPRLRVGQQWVDTVGVSFTDCAAALPAVGDYLELRANSVPGFQPGDPLATVTSARCTTPVPLGTPGAVGVLEGVVSVAAAQSFRLGALEVLHDSGTVFEFGTADDLDPGVDLVVEGSFVDADTLSATLVEFVRPVVRFEAPLVPADVSPGHSIRPFGVSVYNSAQLRDEDAILANGLTVPRQVQVRGWLARDGLALATRIRERGNPDATDVALRGPVAAIAAPTVRVQGLTLDTGGASFFDADNQPLSSTAFFAALQLNHVVDVGGALWTPATRTLSGGVITLLGFEHTQPVLAPAGAVMAGTVRSYGVETPLFGDGFE